MARLPAAIALGLGVLLSWPSVAATVEPIQGDVSINQGDGVFRPILVGRLRATIGDAIMVRPGGRARIVYEDSCVVEVKPGVIATITGKSPCNPSDIKPVKPSEFSVSSVIAAGEAAVGTVVGKIRLLLKKVD
jgi:hypothetical protein